MGAVLSQFPENDSSLDKQKSTKTDVPRRTTQKNAAVVVSVNPSHLYVENVTPLSAEWGNEGWCCYLRRFAGLKGDSAVSKLRIKHTTIEFLTEFERQEYKAASRIQKTVRSYLHQAMWKSIVMSIIQQIRSAKARIRDLQDQETLLQHFKKMLRDGFTCQKLASNGIWKTVKMQLSCKNEEKTCYLTWSPSRKLFPRISMVEIREVCPLKKGDECLPRKAVLSSSYKKSLVFHVNTGIYTLFVIQLQSVKEKEIVFKGFQVFIETLKSKGIFYDPTGILRSSRSKAAFAFFYEDIPSIPMSSNQEGKEHSLNDMDPLNGEKVKLPLISTSSTSFSSSSSSQLEQFFNTRFDQLEETMSSSSSSTTREQEKNTTTT